MFCIYTIFYNFKGLKWNWLTKFCYLYNFLSGLHNVAGRDTVKLYCPRCKDVYVPASGTRGATVDGAFFGTGFPHMAFMTRPEYRPGGRYVAKLYGFRIYESEENRQSALLPNGDVVRHTLLPRP